MTKALTEALKTQKKSTPRKQLQITGTLGIPFGGQKTVEVAGRKSFVYVKLRDNTSEVIQAFNNKVAPSYGLPVVVEWTGNRYVVVSVDTVRYQNNWNSFAPFLPRHANTHSFDPDSSGGGDVVWVHSRQMMPALIIPSGSAGGPNVILSSYTLKNADGSWKYVGITGTSSLLPYKPSSPTGAQMALVYLDSLSGNPYFIIGSGTFMPSTITGSAQIVPYIPTLADPNHIPLAAVRLVTGTAFIGWDNVYDVRQWIHTVPTGTGGGGSSTGTSDSTYLRLDTNNDPLTGELQIIPTASGTPALFAKTKANTSVIQMQQIGNGVSDVDRPLMLLYRGSGTSSPDFDSYVVEVDEDIPNTTNNFGGMWWHRINGITVLSFNPRMPASGMAYLLNTSSFLTHVTGSNDGGILSVQNEGEEVFRAASWGILVPEGKYLEFNRAVPGKEANAGKIGYELFTSGFLEIVGAGTEAGERWVKVYDNLKVESHLKTNGFQVLGLVNSWVYLNGTGTAVGPNFAPEKLFVTGTDWVLGIDSSNVSYKLKVDAFSYQYMNISGWIPRGETWTRTGNHTFTLVGNRTDVYRKGTKVRYNDGSGNEYGVVASSSHSSGTTTVTLISNTDYAMAAASITDTYISYIENPDGFPGWFNWNANPQGFSAVPTNQFYRWQVHGTLITLIYYEPTNGTSNATTFTATAPVAAQQSIGANLNATVDNGTTQTTPGRVVITGGTTTMTFRSDTANGAWTNANGKRAIAVIAYEF